MTKYVSVNPGTRNKNGVYHTSLDCHDLPLNYRETRPSEESDLRECSACAGTNDPTPYADRAKPLRRKVKDGEIDL